MRTDEEEFTMTPGNKRKHDGTSKNPPKKKANKALMTIKEEVEEEYRAEALAKNVPQESCGQMNAMKPAPEGASGRPSTSSKMIPQQKALYTSQALSDLKLLFRRVKSTQ